MDRRSLSPSSARHRSRHQSRPPCDHSSPSSHRLYRNEQEMYSSSSRQRFRSFSPSQKRRSFSTDRIDTAGHQVGDPLSSSEILWSQGGSVSRTEKAERLAYSARSSYGFDPRYRHPSSISLMQSTDCYCYGGSQLFDASNTKNSRIFDFLTHIQKMKREGKLPSDNQDEDEDAPSSHGVVSYTKEELAFRGQFLASTRALYDRLKFEMEFSSDTLNLSGDESDVFEQNPHLRQVFANRFPFCRIGRQLKASDRLIDFESSERMPYRRRRGEAKTVDHWGQRKLLLSEIEFLTLYSQHSSNMLVVYAGAAPGTHTNFLANLFPHLRFVLVDPAPFDTKPSDSIVVRRDYFTNAIAREYRDSLTPVLFISDVRSTDFKMTDEERESRVVEDMKMQADWHRIIHPAASMFKFRLPYTPGSTRYLEGKFFLPVFGGRTTTECRLVVEDAEGNEREYDHTVYEQIMFYHNSVRRTQYWDHDISWGDGDGLDHCYDCASEIHILSQYLSKFHGVDSSSLTREVVRMSKNISDSISRHGRRLRINTDDLPSFIDATTGASPSSRESEAKCSTEVHEKSKD